MSGSSLRDLARAVGLDPDYTSWRGEPVAASDESVRLALRALAPALGIDIDKPDSLRAFEHERWLEVAPPVVLAWDGRVSIPFQVPAEMDLDWEAEVTTEQGGVFHARGRLFDLPADNHAWPGGVVHCVRRAEVWLEGQLGYHTLKWKTAGTSGEALVIAAPTKAWGQPGYGARRWGVFAPVYGLASPQSGAAGDLANLERLMHAVERRGGRYVSVLPILAAFLDEPYAFSPYSPASRLYWNELYLDLQKVAVEVGLHVPQAPPIVADTPIDYRAQYRWRRPFIDECAQRLLANEPFAAGVDAWARDRGVYDYAAFRALGEQQKKGWRDWPAELRDGTRFAATREGALALGAEAARIDTHVVSQWLMQSQLQQLQGGAVSLYLDLPVGVNCDAYEVWRWRDLFLTELAAGAPPDALFLGGQNWGLPPLSPLALRRDRYRYFIACVRHHMKVAGMLRIDHVMGLFRLWWVPPGCRPSEGTYIGYDHEALVGILVLEAHRAGAVVVGEDLGTVEPWTRDYLRHRGILGTSVLWFEKDPAGAPLPPADWRELCLASVTTHDLPPTAGYLAGEHIDLRERLGLLTRPVDEERRADDADRQALLSECRDLGVLGDDDVAPQDQVEALHRLLTLTPARLIGVSLADAVGDRRTINQPGTIDEYPNWRVPLADGDGSPLLLEDIVASDRVRSLADTVATLRR